MQLSPGDKLGPYEITALIAIRKALSKSLTGPEGWVSFARRQALSLSPRGRRNPHHGGDELGSVLEEMIP